LVTVLLLVTGAFGLPTGVGVFTRLSAGLVAAGFFFTTVFAALILARNGFDCFSFLLCLRLRWVAMRERVPHDGMEPAEKGPSLSRVFLA
jgi:hypothetical protein